MTNEETLTKNYFYKNEEVKLVMLDTAGQSEYTPALPNRYCIGVHGYILTFSIDDNHSFEVVQHVNKILLDNEGFEIDYKFKLGRYNRAVGIAYSIKDNCEYEYVYEGLRVYRKEIQK